MRREITKPQTTAVISLWICSLRACSEFLASTQLTFLKFLKCSRLSEFNSNRE